MFSNPLLRWGTVIFALLVLCFLLFAPGKHNATKNSSDNTASITNTANADTTVETLKTLTAEMAAVQDQNQQLISQNKTLKEKDATMLAKFKQEVIQQVQQELDSYKAQQQTKTITDANKQSVLNNVTDKADTAYVINPDNLIAADGLTWINDMQHHTLLPLADEESRKKNDSDFHSLLNPSQTEEPFNQSASMHERKPIPYYTLPVNATLTDAIAMQPLVGRIPINGKVSDPFSFKVIIGPKNLAANGVDIPADIQGIVASGIAAGDMLGSCARGNITAMTFVFQDGRISTAQAKAGDSLGQIAAANGNPCIPGHFYSNAPLYLGVTSGLAGIQGYANALSQAQTSTTLSSGTDIPISAIIKNGNKFAMGQGISAAAIGAQRWWDQRIQNSFDFVYVPNVDPKTGKKLKLNINITQEIAIDYDYNQRKVFYANTHKESLPHLD